MNRALAVVPDESDPQPFLGEVGDIVAGVDAELVVLAVVPDEEYQETRTARADSGASGPTLDEAEENARRRAASASRAALDGVDYEVIGAIGDPVETVLDVAEVEDCDHLFLRGRRRSPTGKALFGDVTQQLLLSFDGMISVEFDG